VLHLFLDRMALADASQSPSRNIEIFIIQVNGETLSLDMPVHANSMNSRV
jgi:hypothetical protein